MPRKAVPQPRNDMKTGSLIITSTSEHLHQNSRFLSNVR